MHVVGVEYLLSIALISMGATYIITCSRIGFWIRAMWVLLFGYIPLVRKLTTLIFCPGCCAFWIGLVTAFLLDGRWWVALQCALVSCGVAAVADGVARLAKWDDDYIRAMWQRIGKHLRGE